ncbi:mitochondrial 39-S ribosomal protein L47 (MRP-L47)-domain-containing protein [Geopyxis carbonaria]|nr:mitochondrial 39-S ribosomal protein L47 (MRP-L47)-domain-containing protein [Geopyxis carbonaria]
MTTVASFHTSMVQSFPRHTRDMNSDRGISPLHRRPQKEPLGAEKHGIPQPVLDPARRTKIETDPDHGLWGFFQEQKALPTPEEDHKHGRAWTVEELRQKSWDDLHKLWWKCVRERNIIETQAQERKRLQPGYGDFEANDRKRQVKWTQRAIKHALTERYYAWQEAQELAKIDPEVDLSGNGPAYNPLSLEV